MTRRRGAGRGGSRAYARHRTRSHGALWRLTKARSAAQRRTRANVKARHLSCATRVSSCPPTRNTPGGLFRRDMPSENHSGAPWLGGNDARRCDLALRSSSISTGHAGEPRCTHRAAGSAASGWHSQTGEGVLVCPSRRQEGCPKCSHPLEVEIALDPARQTSLGRPTSCGGLWSAHSCAVNHHRHRRRRRAPPTNPTRRLLGW